MGQSDPPAVPQPVAAASCTSSRAGCGHATGHGPQFCGVMVSLVAAADGADAARYLLDAYTRAGCEIDPGWVDFDGALTGPPLVDSIREVGLLHPVVVTASNRLVAGQRRLEACRRLGFEQIPVTVATNLTSAAAVLMAERDENTCRKEMTPLERKSLTDALLELERPAAEERMKAGRPWAPRSRGSGKAADIAAEA